MGNILLNRVNTLKSPEKETRTHYGVLNLEKRKYPRFGVDSAIEYFPIDSPALSRGRTLNISGGGLMIYLSEQMDISQCLLLRVFFSLGSELNRIELLAEVVWVDMHIDEGWGDYRSGVKFVDISPDDLTKLKGFLKGLSQPPYTR